jgi:two-component system invasion response regulator UvrY
MTTTARLRILVADDHELVRRWLRTLLESSFKGALVQEAQNARQTLELVRQKSWDLLLLDLGLPDRNGLDILQDIRNARPNLPLLVLSGLGEDEFAVPVLKAGANGFVSKAGPVQELTLAIRKVMEGGKYVSPALADKLALNFLSDSTGLLHESLSQREFQVLRLIANGQSAKMIAATLCLSVKTVSTYRARLLEKMQMKSNAELTRYALKQHLVE